MNKLLLYPALAVCLLASCKKSEKKKLIGDWLQTEWGHDANNNKIIDGGELKKAATGPMMDNIYTFKSGDELKVLFGDYLMDGEWKLKNGGDELVVTLDNRETKYKILTLDDTKLQLETTGNGDTLYWQTLAKQ